MDSGSQSSPAGDFEAFERNVLEALLEGDHPDLRLLRAQFSAASVRERERSEYGCFTDLWVPDGVEPIAMTDRFALDDLFGRVEGVDEEVGFLLHVVRGRIKTLEAFVARPVWPERVVLLDRWYVAPDPDPEQAGQLVRAEGRRLEFALRGLAPREEDD